MRFALIVIFIYLVGTSWAQEANDPKNVHEFYGSQALEIIKSPDRVWAVLLKDNANGKIKERVKRVELSNESQQTASNILISNKTYGWEIWKPCLPVYGARFIFQKGSHSILIDFCFDCDILTASTSPERTVSEDFDSQKTRLLEIFQNAFPRDKTIQRIR